MKNGEKKKFGDIESDGSKLVVGGFETNPRKKCIFLIY